MLVINKWRFSSCKKNIKLAIRKINDNIPEIIAEIAVIIKHLSILFNIGLL